MRRREMLAGLAAQAGVAAPASFARAAAPPDRLEFAIWRNGARIGTHSVRLRRDADTASAEIEAELTVRIGPVPVFRHRHTASETWAGGRLQRLDARTVSNGIATAVSARAEPGALAISRDGRRLVAAAPDAAALTHWNAEALGRPLFNPETGALLHAKVARAAPDQAPAGGGRTIPATRYALSGDAQIVDWYDADGVWCALRSRAPDGSWVEYVRL